MFWNEKHFKKQLLPYSQTPSPTSLNFINVVNQLVI
jgi:hypothetical protein